jgi:integrase
VSEGVYRVLFLTALKTGMRLGELSALTWADVDLTDATIRLRQSYTGGELSSPKNHEQRSVDLTAELVELLGAWWGALGRSDDEKLVFPGETPDGYLNPTTVLRRARRPDRAEAHVSLVPPHPCEGGARDRPAADLAEPASRA